MAHESDELADATANQAQEHEEDMDHDINTNSIINGATIEVIDRGDGDYLVEQKVPQQAPTPPVHGDHSISWSFGPFTATGTVNTDSYSISVNITILGISLGGFHGNLKEGLSIKVNLVAVKGEVRFYLKNGNEVWVYLNLKVLFDGSFDADHKLITI